MKILKLQNIKLTVIIILFLFFEISFVTALPFNDDMVESQISSGQVMRPKAKDSVAKGASKIISDSWMETAQETNPIKSTQDSLENGNRLYQINCMPCHGQPKIKGYQKGEVGKLIGPLVPNLAEDRIINLTDGHIFSTIRNGSLSTLMPAIGWKVSIQDTWDIVNYVRETQKSEQFN